MSIYLKSSKTLKKKKQLRFKTTAKARLKIIIN